MKIIGELKSQKTRDFFVEPTKFGKDGQKLLPAEGSIRLDEALELQRLVSEFQPQTTLEIGLACGASAVAITEVMEQYDVLARHVVLDPFQSDSLFGEAGLLELERLKLRHRIEFMPLFSFNFLYDCLKQNRRFDLIFNDGGHSIGCKVTDAFLGDQCLNSGGLFIFHDAFMFSVAAAVRYLVKERGYSVVRLSQSFSFKRWLRGMKYGAIHGVWYKNTIAPFTCRNLVALRKGS